MRVELSEDDDLIRSLVAKPVPLVLGPMNHEGRLTVSYSVRISMCATRTRDFCDKNVRDILRGDMVNHENIVFDVETVGVTHGQGKVLGVVYDWTPEVENPDSEFSRAYKIPLFQCQGFRHIRPNVLCIVVNVRFDADWHTLVYLRLRTSGLIIVSSCTHPGAMHERAIFNPTYPDVESNKRFDPQIGSDELLHFGHVGANVFLILGYVG